MRNVVKSLVEISTRILKNPVATLTALTHYQEDTEVTMYLLTRTTRCVEQ